MLPVDAGGAGLRAAAPPEPRRGRPPFDDVLIIGAGSGNDVAAALGSGAEARRRRRDRPGAQRDRPAPTIPTSPYDDPRVTIHLDDGRSFVRKTDQQVRPDRLRPGRLAGAPLGLFEPPAGELPVHRAGVPRHQGAAQARRRVRDVQLLPPGVGRRPARRRWPRRSSAPSRSCISLPYQERDHARRRAGGRTSRSCSSGNAERRPLEAIRERFARGPVLLGRTRSRVVQRGDQRLRARAARRPGDAAGRLAEDRPGRGRDARASARCRPTTGRSSTSASRRSPR